MLPIPLLVLAPWHQLDLLLAAYAMQHALGCVSPTRHGTSMADRQIRPIEHGLMELACHLAGSVGRPEPRQPSAVDSIRHVHAQQASTPGARAEAGAPIPAAVCLTGLCAAASLRFRRCLDPDASQGPGCFNFERLRGLGFCASFSRAPCLVALCQAARGCGDCLRVASSHGSQSCSKRACKWVCFAYMTYSMCNVCHA